MARRRSGSVRFTAKIDDKLLQRLLKRGENKARDLSRVFAGPIRKSVAIAMKRQFDSNGSFFGTPWPPLSATTMKLRTRVVTKGSVKSTTSKRGRAKSGFAKPLRDTDRLFRAATRITDPEGIRDVGRNFLRWGVRVPYAGFHQTGFSTRLFGRGSLRKVPARPIFPRGDNWPPRVRREWIVAIGRAVNPTKRG